MAQPTAQTQDPGQNPVSEPHAGYLFVYFAGDDIPEGEQVHFALSRGNDPLRYRALNKRRPVISSGFGTGGLRDPFVIRSPRGEGFHLIATDLSIHRVYADGGDWDQVQRSGSRCIAVWDSADLVTWTGGRLVEVAPEAAGNAWAPKAHWDDGAGAYLVYWASQLWPEDDTKRTGPAHNVMLCAHTTDFRTFGPAEVWHDPGHHVIDAALIRHEGVYHRFIKDERAPGSHSPAAKFITAQQSPRLRATAYEPVVEGIGIGVIERGEGPAVFKSNTEEKWYLFIDEFGGRGYVPFETDDLASGRWTPCTDYELPRRPRHGCVLPVTRAEYERLLAAYGAEEAAA